MRLQPLSRLAYQRHVLSLDRSDRRLRFGTTWDDAAVIRYATGIDLDRDALAGIVSPDGFVAGAVHMARGHGYAEAGISVAAGHRRNGLGGLLLDTAIRQACAWGVTEFFVHCLAENAAMIHLARTRGMQIVAEAGEIDAFLPIRGDRASGLPRRTATSIC